jgi:hypothetical protein
MLKKKISMLILYLFLSGAIYNLWTLRPVKILYVNSDGYGTINLVVDHLPWTDRDKIDWYLAHMGTRVTIQMLQVAQAA